jgi:hypothetical protein
VGKLSKNQNGFSAIEAILILVILGIIGVTGYFVWHAKQSTDKSLTPNASTTPSYKKSNKSTNPTPTTTTTPQQQYLVIKEWSVKIPLSSTISATYYSYDSNTDFVRVSLDKYKGTNCATDQGQLYGISRSTNASSSGVKIGNYYYSPVHPQTGCDGTTSSTWNSNSAGATQAMSYVPYLKTAIGRIMAE